MAAVRVPDWRYAYAGITPQSYLDALAEAGDAARHRERLTGGWAGVRDLVAVDGSGAVVGWASSGGRTGAAAVTGARTIRGCTPRTCGRM